MTVPWNPWHREERPKERKKYPKGLLKKWRHLKKMSAREKGFRDYDEQDRLEQRVKEKGNLPEPIKQFIEDAVDFGSWPTAKIQQALKDAQKVAKEQYSNRGSYILGDILTRYLGWALPSKEAIQIIKKNKVPGPIYDVMAGTGYWSAALNKAGVPSKASDVNITAKKNPWGLKPQYGNVSRKNAVTLAVKWAAIGKPVNVLLSWIPEGFPLAAADLPKGSIVFLVGEGKRLPGPFDALFHVSEKYEWVPGGTELVGSGGKANWSDRTFDSSLSVYKKVKDSELKIESIVKELAIGSDLLEDVLEVLID